MKFLLKGLLKGLMVIVTIIVVLVALILIIVFSVVAVISIVVERVFGTVRRVSLAVLKSLTMQKQREKKGGSGVVSLSGHARMKSDIRQRRPKQ